MTTAIYRSVSPDLELRSGGDGRTIHGIAVPWRAPVQIDSNLREQFAEGAFNDQLRAVNRVRFAREHVALGGTLIGATRLLRSDASGLYGEWYVSRTPTGDETLELVKDGALRELSIGFYEGQNRRLADGTIERTTASLFEVAVVMQGAYGELAAAAGVRSIEGSVGQARANLAQVDQILARLTVLPPPA